MIRKIGIKLYVLRLGFFMLYYPLRSSAFKGIRKKMRRTKRGYNDKSLQKIANEFDKIIIGGDQLWSTKPTMYNTNYFLPWVKEREKKVCYAASIAQPDVRPEIVDEFVRNVRGFGYVTSREEWTRELIKKYSDVEAPRVCDPIFLLTEDEWRLLQVPDLCMQNKPFIFVYQIEVTLSMIEMTERISKETGFEVVYSPFPLRKHIKCHRKPYISPEEWLWYVDNAELVITDSFHGTAFSICFNTDFYTQVAVYNAPTSSRVTNILEVFSLQDRFVNDIDVYSKESIDWEQVNRKIDVERSMSLEHLTKMLEM